MFTSGLFFSYTVHWAVLGCRTNHFTFRDHRKKKKKKKKKKKNRPGSPALKSVGRNTML